MGESEGINALGGAQVSALSRKSAKQSNKIRSQELRRTLARDGFGAGICMNDSGNICSGLTKKGNKL